MTEKQILKKVEKKLNQTLKKQTQEGLAKAFTELKCAGVANQIKQGKNVTGNVEYGIKHCLHEKLGPRVDPKTLEFFPQTKKAREMEHKFIALVNKTLENGGFPKVKSTLLSEIRKGDRAFEKTIIQRRKEK